MSISKDTKTIKLLIVRNTRLFSGLLFAISTLLLFGIHTFERLSPPQEIIVWLQVADEVLKGLLAAAAVTFLYDWILKEENAAQTTLAVSEGLQKFSTVGLGAKLTPHTRAEYLYEAVLHPFEGESVEQASPRRFCRLCIHSRFRSVYLGDRVTFALVSTREQVESLRRSPECLFRWQSDHLPLGRLGEPWLDVTNFRVMGQTWAKEKTKISDDSIIVSFRRTSRLVDPPDDVAYEFDLRTVEAIQGDAVSVDFYGFYTLTRPTFRFDARALHAKDVRADITFDTHNVFQGQYVSTPEGLGTWQVYVNGNLEPIQSIRFFASGIVSQNEKE